MELYINDIQVDIDDRLPFPLTYQISDIKDISSRKGSSSKTIKLPGTQKNVKLMSGVFVVSASSSKDNDSAGFDNFDPTIKSEARYYEKGVLQFKGLFQLRSCVKLNGEWSFEGVLFQDTIDIIKLLSNYKLRELGWSEYNHTLNETNQSDSWSGNIIKDGVAYSNTTGTAWDGEGYYYGLIDYGFDRPNADTFRVADIAPQIFVKNIVDKMFDKIGVTVDSDFFDSDKFKKLLLAYEGGEFPVVDSATSTANSVYTDWLTDVSGEVLNATQEGKEITTNYFGFENNLYNLFYQSDSATSTDPSGLLQSEVPLNFICQNPGLYKLTIDGSIVTDLDFTVTGGSGYTIDWTKEIKVTIFKNGDIYQQDFLQARKIDISTSLTNSYTVTGTFMFDLQLATSDTIEVRFGFTNEAYIRSSTLGVTSLTSELTIAPTIGLDVELQQVSITEGSTVNIAQFLPEDMTCADFLLGLNKMFNLMITPNKDDPKTLEIEPFDDFYLGTQSITGADITLDLTDKVDRSKEWRVTPTINFATKEYNFEFADSSDFYSEQYQNDVSKQYGAKTQKNSSSFATGETSYKLPFTQVPITDNENDNLIIPRCYQVKEDVGFSTIKPKKGKPFIVQVLNADAGTLRTGAWTHKATSKSTYPYVGHLDDPDTPTFDLLFSPPDYAMYSISGGTDYTNNNLYGYHERGLKELVSRHGKMLECHAKLDANIINTLDFKRLVKIDGVVYRLNKIMNYDSGTIDTTKIELIKLIDGSNIKTITYGKETDPYVVTSLNIPTNNVPTGSAKKYLGVDSDGKMIKADIGEVYYVAELSQTGTSAPTANVLVNNTGGTVVWTRSSAGVYVGTLAGAFGGSLDCSISIYDTNQFTFAYQGETSDTVVVETNTDGELAGEGKSYLKIIKYA